MSFFNIMKYGSEIIKEICKYVRAGNTYKDAALLVGVSRETFHKWKREKPVFSDSLKKAELQCKARNIAIIQKSAETTWQAAAWWLERKYNNEFALKNIQELQGKDGGPISVNLINDYVYNAEPQGDVSPSRDNPEGQA